MLNNNDTSQVSKRIVADARNNLYSHIAAARPVTSGIRRINSTNNNSTRIVGKAVGSSLKAAAKDNSSIAVFCISNVSFDLSIDDIRKHCREIGVRIRFIYDVTKGNYNARAFKLAVGVNEVIKILNPELWPEGVSIRSWRPYNITAQSGTPSRNTYIMSSSDGVRLTAGSEGAAQSDTQSRNIYTNPSSDGARPAAGREGACSRAL